MKAKLLKEKGFDVPVYQYYFPPSNDDLNYSEFDNDWNSVWEHSYSAPTYQMTLKWLREVYNLHITIKPYITEEGIMYLFEIYKLEAEKFTLIKTKTGFEKSELANEAAIKYSLENLI